MTSLFDPIRVGAMSLPNRVVMAPLTRNRAPGAMPNPLMATYYAQRADPQDGAGLIVSEATAISHQGQGYAQVPGIWGVEQVEGWKRVTDAVHAAGGTIVVQLWHVGRISHTSLQPGGQAPVAPSAIAAKARTYLVDAEGEGAFVAVSAPRELEAAEIPGIVNDYRSAARNAMLAGFDGVEIHAANGYLIDQFLRSGANQRTDDWGGTIENRARLLLEVVRAVTAEIGGDRVGLRLSPVTPSNDASDPNPQPLFEYAVQALAPLNLAYLHVIEGQTGGARDYTQGDKPFDYGALREAYRKAGGRAAWMVNNSYDEALAQRALADGVDLVAFGRPFISNPDLARRLRESAPLATLDMGTLYGGGEAGYTDYPGL